jgi:hypothetical protein
MKKSSLIPLLLTPILLACNPSTDQRVVIPFSDEMKTSSGNVITLNSYNALESMVSNEETFIIVIGNSTCLCTLDFLPVLSQWIQETNIPVYYLEFTLILYQEQKFNIPVLNGNAPILNIFDSGTLKHFQAYNTTRTSENAFFYNLDLLTTWFNTRIILPSFQFLSKANFDALFLENKRMMIYIGREDCPDCTYAFNTFVIPFLKANKNLPPIYGLDVMLNGIRVPVVPGQESTTGNNTPGWETFKAEYGLNTVLNTTFGYATGFVPTFMIIEANGNLIKDDPSIIKDMIVTYNDSSLQDPTRGFNADTNPRTTSLTRTFFDGSRPLQYTTLNLTTLTLPVHDNSQQLREILKPYHNGAMLEFLNYYLPLLG